MRSLDPGSPGFGRRRLLVVAGAAVGLALVRGRLHDGPAQAAGPHAPPPGALPPHAAPEIRVPVLTENGAKVPVVVEVEHPMESAHHVTAITVVNERDPIPSKGEFFFSPANGQAYIAFQARLDDGPSTVQATVECSLGARWAGTAPTRVVDVAGGCGGPVPKPERASTAIRPPAIRLPREVRGEPLAAGQLLDVQVKIQHPVRTGLERRDGKWVQADEPFYLTEMDVFLDALRVSHFALTPAVSDNPFITFRLRPPREGLLRVAFRNNRGARLDAEHAIRFA
ncbi:MAG TPA: thiosulfate oxidation carrier protein SoxY [Methylomirabilota bacterium]|nr:thiosulfate oxidation carrier protein SoxY [Methylomirabilota bacterium]